MSVQTWPAWCTVLGIRPDATPTEIDRAYRARAKAAHPDKGGSVAAMQALNDARDKAKEANR